MSMPRRDRGASSMSRWVEHFIAAEDIVLVTKTEWVRASQPLRRARGITRKGLTNADAPDPLLDSVPTLK